MFKVNRKNFSNGLFIKNTGINAPQTKLFISNKMTSDEKIKIKMVKEKCKLNYSRDRNYNYFQRIFGETIIPRKRIMQDDFYQLSDMSEILNDFFKNVIFKYRKCLQDFCGSVKLFKYYIDDFESMKKEAIDNYLFNFQINTMPCALNLVGQAVTSCHYSKPANFERVVKNMAIGDLYKMLFIDYLKEKNINRNDAINTLNKYFEELRYNIDCYRSNNNDIFSLEMAFSKLIGMSLFLKTKNNILSSKKAISLLESDMSIQELLKKYSIDNPLINEFMYSNDLYGYQKLK